MIGAISVVIDWFAEGSPKEMRLYPGERGTANSPAVATLTVTAAGVEVSSPSLAVKVKLSEPW